MCPVTVKCRDLMAYALRKQSKANLDKAQFDYQKVLAIDTRHKRSREYHNELLLMKKDLNGAIETYQKGQ